MSNQQFTVTDRGSYFANFRHANGQEYRGELTGCGEAFEVRDEDGEIVTAIPTDQIGSLQDQDIRLAANAISTIEANKARIKAVELEKQRAEEAEAAGESEGFAMPQFNPLLLAILRQRMAEHFNSLRQSGTEVHIGELHIHLHINA